LFTTGFVRPALIYVWPAPLKISTTKFPGRINTPQDASAKYTKEPEISESKLQDRTFHLALVAGPEIYKLQKPGENDMFATGIYPAIPWAPTKSRGKNRAYRMGMD